LEKTKIFGVMAMMGREGRYIRDIVLQGKIAMDGQSMEYM
jgi:hypothetical protein